MLIDPIDASNSDLLAVRANNAPEMKVKLEAALTAAIPSALQIWDLQLVADGAAPNFLALVTLAGGEGSGLPVPRTAISTTRVATADAIDPIELSEQIAADLIANGNGQSLWKAVSAGGGFGPHWMSVAFYNAAPG